MGVFLFCIAMLGVTFLICYASWHYGRNKNDPKKYFAEREEKMKHSILDVIYKEANREKDLLGSHTLKIFILETLNISPSDLRRHLKILLQEKLVLESEASVALTSFGANHYEVFVKNKRKE